MNEPNQTGRIEINTPFGKLFAELAGDTDYPGIYICIEQENDVDGKYERQLVLVECTTDVPETGKKSMRLFAWGNSDVEDYTDDITFDILPEVC
jgi:hypothetical protein